MVCAWAAPSKKTKAPRASKARQLGFRVKGSGLGRMSGLEVMGQRSQWGQGGATAELAAAHLWLIN